MPERIQLRRTPGWRKPADVIVVARPSVWGNPYRRAAYLDMIVDRFGNEYDCAPGEWRGVAVRKFREDLMDGRLPCSVEDVEAELAGRDLACWCPLGQPCHADVLLELANREPRGDNAVSR